MPGSTCVLACRRSFLPHRLECPDATLRGSLAALFCTATMRRSPAGAVSERLMTMERIAAAIHRVESILKRRPTTAVHEDAPAIARWQSGTRVVSEHPNGASVATDMPSELGGTGDLVTPGWLWRAALGSCLTTRIVMAAAAEGMTSLPSKSRRAVAPMCVACWECAMRRASCPVRRPAACNSEYASGHEGRRASGCTR